MKKIAFFLFLCAMAFVSKGQTNGIVIPTGHGGSLSSVITDQQQKYIYALEAHQVIMWELKTGRQLYTFDLHGSGDITDFSVSNDGTKMVTANRYFTVVFSTIDGKEIYRNKAGDKAIFSADGKKLYTSDNYFFREGYDEIDLETKKVTRHLVCSKSDPNCPMAIDVKKVSDSEWLIFLKGGWRIYDFSKNQETLKIDLPIPEKGKDGYDIYRNYKLLVEQELVLMYGEDKLSIYQMRTGQLLHQFPLYNQNYIAIPSTDRNEFGLTHLSMNNNEIRIYDAKTFTVKKTLNASKLIPLSAIDERFDVIMRCPSILANKKQLLISQGTDLKLLDLESNKVVRTYRDQLTGYGIDFVNNGDYNYKSQRLNFNFTDSTFRSIDMKRLVPVANRSYGYTNAWTEVVLSSTGDTVGIIPSSGMVLLRNTKSGKRTTLNFGARDKEGANTGLPDFFFSKDGIHGYVYTTVLARYDKFTKTLHRVNLKTGLMDQPVVYAGDVESYQDYLDIDRELLTVFTQTPAAVTIKTWNLRTAKIIINRTYPRAGWKNHASPQIVTSADGKKIAYMMSSMTEFFSLTTGALLYTTPMAQITGNSKVTIANRSMSQFVTFLDDGKITSKDSTGKITYEIQAHRAFIRALYFSEDDRILFTLSSDGTIKAWNAATGAFYGTLYVFKDANDYVFMDKYGRFDGSPEGIKKIYYLSGRSIIPLDVIYERFYTPNLYVRLINGEVFEPIEIRIKPLPQVKVNYASAQRNLDVVEDDVPSYQNTTGFADITVKAVAPDDAVDEIRLFHNGKIVTLTTRNLIVTDDKSESSSKTYQLTLLPGVNNIRAVALNTQRTESQPDEILVRYNTGNAGGNTPVPVAGGRTVVETIDRNATVHLIVVGINQYKNPKMSLNYALADATAFKTEAEKGARSLISNVKTYFVTDGAADRAGIEQAFKEVQKIAKAEDVLMFYYAGHGVISEKNKEFYLVPTDVTDLKNVDVALIEKGIPSKLLQQYAIDIAAQKQVFILDACQSAGAFETLLKGDGDQQKSLAVVARSTGTHWIAASGSQQFANEFSDLGHGAFTYVLLKAMAGGAKNNNMITVNGLKNFLQVQVPELMKKYNGTPQYPASFGLGSDFPVEIIQ